MRIENVMSNNLVLLGCIVVSLLTACAEVPQGNVGTASVSNTSAQTVGTREGNLAKRGGTGTVRKPYSPGPDNPATTNDERNDQPKGHFGTITLSVTNVSSGATYSLDADVTEDGSEFHLERLYFPKGGWVDFIGCDLDEDYLGFCQDENGRSWDINGE